MAAGLLQSDPPYRTFRVSAEKMIDGLTANVERCRFLAEVAARPHSLPPDMRLLRRLLSTRWLKVTVREAAVALGCVERMKTESSGCGSDVTKMLGNLISPA